MLEVVAVPVLTDNYVWLIHNGETGETAAVDPSVAEPVLDAVAAKGWSLTQVLNTHWHPDHTGGNEGIKNATGAPITAPAEAQRVSTVDRIVAEGDRVTVAGAEAVVWDIPAHTAGHIAYYFEDEGMIFVGDTMFAMGAGRIFEGNAEMMWKSLQKLSRLPRDTEIYCGHEYTQSNAAFALTLEPDNQALVNRAKEVDQLRKDNKPTLPTRLDRELETNPFLRPHVTAIRAKLGMLYAPDWHVFAAIRERKNKS